MAHSEVRVTFPLPTANGDYPVPGNTVISGLAANTFRGMGIDLGVGAATELDAASSKRTYRVGQPSCVRVGA